MFSSTSGGALLFALLTCSFVEAAPAIAAPLLLSNETAFAAQPAAADHPPPQDVAVSVQGSFQRLVQSSSRMLPGIAAALIVLGVFWALAAFVRVVVRKAARYVRDPTIKLLLVQVSYYAVWLVGCIVALDAVGVNPESVVTALGLTGVALGFALREVLSNFVSGVLILALRFFDIGDQIVVGDTEGTVEAIDLRATHIRTGDGRLVFVPNAEVSTSRVTNNSASPLRRTSIFVYLSYREDVARTLSIVLATLRDVAGIASTPAPTIQLNDLAPQHLQVEARFWADSRRADFINIVSTARIAIVGALAKEGIELPLPTTPGAAASAPDAVLRDPYTFR